MLGKSQLANSGAIMGRARQHAEDVACVKDRQDRPDPQSQPDAVAELRTLSTTARIYDDGPEFSSEPMPAALPAFVFLGIGLLVCVILAFLL
jgi:hypothetical protein